MFRKSSPTLTVPNPCTEKWEAMTPTETGRHCHTCDQCVVDFTEMSDAQIAAYLQANRGACGRFRASQLNSNVSVDRTSGTSWKRALPLAAALGAAVTVNAQIPGAITPNVEVSQSKERIKIEGLVVDSNGALGGAEVAIAGLEMRTISGADGRFELWLEPSIVRSHREIQIGLAGYETRLLHTTEFEQACPRIILELQDEVVADSAHERVANALLTDSLLYVRGTVRDEQGRPLPFVTVVMGEEAGATTTDFDGHFELEVDASLCGDSPVLSLSFVGFERQTIALQPLYVSHLEGHTDAITSLRMEVDLIEVRLQEMELMGELMVVGTYCYGPTNRFGRVTRKVVQPVKRLGARLLGK